MNQEANATTANTTNTIKDRCTILLQRAIVAAFGEAFGEASANSALVHILFDSGSQMSYVTESIQRKLNLPIKVKKLHLNTFGPTGYKTQSCSLVKLFV